MKPTGVFGCLFILLFVNLTVGGLLTQYVLEFWLSYARNTPVDLPFWLCALVGLFLGEFMIPAALITLVCSYVLVPVAVILL